MGNLGKNRKKFLALAIALSLQMQAVMPCYAAVTAEAGGANVNGNIINIVNRTVMAYHIINLLILMWLAMVLSSTTIQEVRSTIPT